MDDIRLRRNILNQRSLHFLVMNESISLAVIHTGKQDSVYAEVKIGCPAWLSG